MSITCRCMAGVAAVAILALSTGVPIAAAQTVYFDPSESVPTDPEFVVPLAIDCGPEAVKGAEIRVAYDPFLVRLDAITPGAWFTDAGVTHYFYDYTPDEAPGLIHLASSVLGGTLGGAGVLANCHFTILDFGVTPLVFQDVDVRGAANEVLPFQPSSGDRIVLDPVVETAVSSFGTIKALYR